MASRSACLCAYVALAATLPAGAARAQEVGPVGAGQWEVVQRDRGCRIAAPGDDAGPSLFLPFEGRPHVGLSLGYLAPSQLEALDADLGTVYVDGTRALPVEVEWITLVGARSGPSYHLLAVFTDDTTRVAEVLSGADELRVEFVGRGPAPISLHGLRPALEESRRCRERVGLALLGVTPDTPPDRLPPPRENPLPREAPRRWIDPANYPPEAIAANAEGVVRVAVNVDRNGHPTGCRIVQSADLAALDAAACDRLMAKATFYPAIGPEGSPVESVWETAVNWHLTR